MFRKIADQFSTLLVVIAVLAFCASGAAGMRAQKEPESPESEQENMPQSTAAETSIPAAKSVCYRFPGEAPDGYFRDALFIGDSRTLGLQEYGSLTGAAFFASSGMNVYNVWKEEIAGKSLEALLDSEDFGKIYIMLGINELGYDQACTAKKYGELVEAVASSQPDSVIILEANLHVSASRSETDSVYNNKSLNAFNSAVAELADGERIFYLDVNTLFDDDGGNLAKEYTADGTHVLGKYYLVWSEWLAGHAAVPK